MNVANYLTMILPITNIECHVLIVSVQLYVEPANDSLNQLMIVL